MRFCVHCGKSLDNDSRFCTGCGSKAAVPAQPRHAATDAGSRQIEKFPQRAEQLGIPQTPPPSQPAWTAQATYAPPPGHTQAYTPAAGPFQDQRGYPQSGPVLARHEYPSDSVQAQRSYPQDGTGNLRAKKKIHPVVIVLVLAIAAVAGFFAYRQFFSEEKKIAGRVETFFDAMYTNDFYTALEILDPTVSVPMLAVGQYLTDTYLGVDIESFLAVITAMGNYMGADNIAFRYRVDKVRQVSVNGSRAEAQVSFLGAEEIVLVELQKFGDGWYIMDMYGAEWLLE